MKGKKDPPGGYDSTPMPPSVGETYTLKLTFHGASNLPPADWGDSADPFILAQINTPLHTRNKHDPHVRFRSATSYKTLDPRWEAVWVVAGIPTPGAEFKIRVYDEDSSSHDDELGKIHLHTGRLSADYAGLDRQTFDLSSRGASVKAWGRKACMKPFSSDARKESTITISIENLGRTDPEVGKVYTANSFYWVHFSAILGHITDTVAPDPDAGGQEDTDFQANELQLAGPAPNALYHRYVEFLPFVKTMFQAKHLRGKMMHELLHREHEKVYHFDPKTRYGTLRNGHERARRFLDMAHWGEGDRVFTYVVTLDGLMRFTETGPEFGIDMLSKHTMHSDVDEWICVSGEFFIRKWKPGDPDGDMVKGVTSSVGDDKAQGIKPAVKQDIKQLKINTQYDGGDSEGGNGEEGERRGPMELKSPSEVGMPSRPKHKRQDSQQSGYYTPDEGEYDDKPVVAAVGGHRKLNSGGRGDTGPEFRDQPRQSDDSYRGHQRSGSNWGAESQRTITRDGPNGAVLGSTVNDFPTPPNVDRSTTATPGHAGTQTPYNNQQNAQNTGSQTPAAYNAQPGSGALVGPNVPSNATGPDGLPTSTALGVFGGAPIDGNGLKGRRGYIATRTVETELPNGRKIVETSRVEVVHKKGEPPQEHREFERHEISPPPRALPLPPDGKPDGPLSPASRKASLPGSPTTTPGVMSPGLSGMGSPTLSAVAAPITIQSVTTPDAGGAHIEEINDEDDKPNWVKEGEARIRDPKQSAQVNRPPSHASVHGSMHESMYAGHGNRVSGASYDQRPSVDNRRSTDANRKSTDGRKSTDRRKSTDKAPSSPLKAMTPANADGGDSRPRSLAGPDHTYRHPGSDTSSVDEHLHDAHLDVNGHPQSAFREDGDVLLAQQRKKNPLLSMKLDKHAARHQRDKPNPAPQLPPQQQSSVRVPLTTEALEHHNSISKKGSPTSPTKTSPRKSRELPTTDQDAIKASLIPQAPAKKSSPYKMVDNPRYSQGQLASPGASPTKSKPTPQHQPLLGAGGQPIGRVQDHPPQLDTLSLNTTGPEFVERDPHGRTVGVLTGPAKTSALELSDSDDDVPNGGFLVYTNERDGKPVEADPYGEKARKRAEEARRQAEEDERQRQADEKAQAEAEKERQKQAKVDAKQSKKDKKAQEKWEKEERKQREREEKEARKRDEQVRKEQQDAIDREKGQKQRQEQEKARAAAAMRDNADAGERARANSMEKPPVAAVSPVKTKPEDHKAGPHGAAEPPENPRHHHFRHESTRKEKHVHPVETNWILGPEDGGSTDPRDYQLIIDNDSGTYRPNKQLMPLFEAWLRQEFPGLHVMAMSCDDDRLQNMKKKRQEKKKERNKGRVWGRRGSHGSMSSVSSSDEDEIKEGKAPTGKKEKRYDFLEHPGQALREKVKMHGDKPSG